MELLKDFEEQLIKIEKRLNPEYTHTGECPQCTELAETVYAIVEDVKSKNIEEFTNEVGKIFIQSLKIEKDVDKSTYFFNRLRKL